MNLTANFTTEEMNCRCGKCGGGSMNMDFMKKLQAVREAFGTPMPVTSGFRCEERNTEEGGSKDSMHPKGRAVDIECLSGSSKFQLMMIAITAGMNGIGVGKTFIHMDDRETQVLWTY